MTSLSAPPAVPAATRSRSRRTRPPVSWRPPCTLGPRPPGETLAAFALDRDFRHRHGIPADAIREALGHASPAHPVMTLALAADPCRRDAVVFPRPDISRHDAIAAFIKVGYEPYARRYAGRFGKTVRYVFTDEPSLPVSDRGLLWSELLSREFRKDRGYRLEDRLGALCFGQEGAAAAAFDYFSTLNRLFLRELRPAATYEWCESHGLDFTGHYNEHEWLNPADTPDAMALLRWMHAPGNDYLAFQIFPTTLPPTASTGSTCANWPASPTNWGEPRPWSNRAGPAATPCPSRPSRPARTCSSPTA